MCREVLNNKTIVARKEHECIAFQIINEAFCGIWEIMDMCETEEEILEYYRLYKNNFKIQKGDKYRSYSFVNNGTIFNCKESLLGAKWCSKHDLYEC